MEWWFQLPVAPLAGGVGLEVYFGGLTSLLRYERGPCRAALHGERLTHELLKCILHVVLVQETHVVHRYVGHGSATRQATT